MFETTNQLKPAARCGRRWPKRDVGSSRHSDAAKSNRRPLTPADAWSRAMPSRLSRWPPLALHQQWYIRYIRYYIYYIYILYIYIIYIVYIVYIRYIRYPVIQSSKSKSSIDNCDTHKKNVGSENIKTARVRVRPASCHTHRQVAESPLPILVKIVPDQIRSSVWCQKCATNVYQGGGQRDEPWPQSIFFKALCLGDGKRLSPAKSTEPISGLRTTPLLLRSAATNPHLQDDEGHPALHSLQKLHPVPKIWPQVLLPPSEDWRMSRILRGSENIAQ